MNHLKLLFAFPFQLCIPDWPMYNRNPVTWLEEVGRSNKSKAAKSASKDKVKKDKAKKAEVKSS
jgi:hypothetical protein